MPKTGFGMACRHSTHKRENIVEDQLKIRISDEAIIPRYPRKVVVVDVGVVVVVADYEGAVGARADLYLPHLLGRRGEALTIFPGRRGE
jgi:3D (Asp-Asp-Asp) domain-containing protein